ncbi:hypothetical protein MG293_015736 [Ovis ammon polii]|uniref:Uncharacterized protein n=1 Tax=Ovis ammon polii TaxID=230172 RepID=A0AAD4TX01_OVIAM|nr:hypothetical protein MG293_015736 [Ovis ammon polii]
MFEQQRRRRVKKEFTVNFEVLFERVTWKILLHDRQCVNSNERIVSATLTSEKFWNAEFILLMRGTTREGLSPGSCSAAGSLRSLPVQVRLLFVLAAAGGAQRGARARQFSSPLLLLIEKTGTLRSLPVQVRLLFVLAAAY